MDFDFEPFFRRYEAISAMADQLFAKVKEAFPDCVTCASGCADCCHALFDMTLIEALYINHKFNERFSGAEKERLLEAANRADRRLYKIKREAYKAVSAGKDEAEVLSSLAQRRERCPLLDDAALCLLYAHRPITCRLYGIPTAIGGKGHTCGLSGFKPGESYPTVNIDNFQRMLYELSAELVAALKSKHIKMWELLVPLSMALLTDYTDEYLGVSPPPEAADGSGNPGGEGGDA